MAKIETPNPNYNGISATVQFTNGVGETADLNLITWFFENGYTVDGKNRNAEMGVDKGSAEGDKTIVYRVKKTSTHIAGDNLNLKNSVETTIKKPRNKPRAKAAAKEETEK